MDYRIKKYHYKNSDDELQTRFCIEYLSVVFWRKPKWKVLRETVCYWGDTYTQDIVFKSEEEARKRVENILKVIPGDVIVEIYAK